MLQPNIAALFLGDGMLAEQGLLSRVLATAPEAPSEPECGAKRAQIQTKPYGITRRACSTFWNFRYPRWPESAMNSPRQKCS